MKVLLNTTCAGLVAGCMLFAAPCSFAATKECKYNAAPQSALSVSTQSGTIDIKPAIGRQLSVSATTNSHRAEVDCHQAGGRVHAITRFTKNLNGNESR